MPRDVNGAFDGVADTRNAQHTKNIVMASMTMPNAPDPQAMQTLFSRKYSWPQVPQRMPLTPSIRHQWAQRVRTMDRPVTGSARGGRIADRRQAGFARAAQDDEKRIDVYIPVITRQDARNDCPARCAVAAYDITVRARWS